MAFLFCLTLGVRLVLLQFSLKITTSLFRNCMSTRSSVSHATSATQALCHCLFLRLHKGQEATGQLSYTNCLVYRHSPRDTPCHMSPIHSVWSTTTPPIHLALFRIIPVYVLTSVNACMFICFRVYPPKPFMRWLIMTP